MDKDGRTPSSESAVFLGETWFDPIEMGIRDRIRGFIEALVNAELNDALGRARYQRPDRAEKAETAREMAGYRRCTRSLAEEDVVRLILDGTVVRVRLDRKATPISLWVVLGIRRDGQKVSLAVRNRGGESEAAWRNLLDDLVSRGLRAPGFGIIGGAAGLEKALGLVWPEALVQRCTVHEHRDLLAHAPERLHEEISAGHNDMIYAGSPKEIETRRKPFLRKWRLKCRAVAGRLEEAGDRRFTFARLPESQWRSARTTNAIERLPPAYAGVERRIKTQTVLPSAEAAAMLFRALLASGQITMRQVDGWQTPAGQPAPRCIDLAA